MALTVLGIAGFSSCDHAEIGIFASIEQERKIEDERKLPNAITVSGITELDGFYFISAPTIYRRSTSNTTDGALSEWEPVDGPTADQQNVSLVRFGDETNGELVAVFASGDGTTHRLYRRGATDAAWTEVDLGTISGQLSLMTASSDPGTVFLTVLAGANDNRVYITSDMQTFDQVLDSDGNPLSSPTPFLDVAYDGTAYWLASRAVLATGADPSASTTDATADPGFPETLEDYSGVFYGGAAGSERLYVSTSVGVVGSVTGAAWATTDEPESVGDDIVPFTDLEFVQGSDGFAAIVVGTDGYGYREVDPDTLEVTVPSRDGNYQSSELATAAVLSFYVDDSAPDLPAAAPAGVDLLFAGTSSMGLWKSYYEGQAAFWTRE